jgi:transposase
VLLPRQEAKLARGAKDKEHAPMSEKLDTAIAVIGIDIGKNAFHVVGQAPSRSVVPAQLGCLRSTP